MKKKILLLTLLVALGCQANAFAAMPDNFASVSQEKGDQASNYIYSTDSKGQSVNYIVKGGTYGSTYTGTNVRSQPSPDVPTAATIEGGKICQILGYAENGWIRVLCKETENGDVVGWIREDLLNPADPTAAQEQPETESQTEQPAETSAEEIEVETEGGTDNTTMLLTPSSDVNIPETQPTEETEAAVETEPENTGMQSMLYLG